MRLMLSAGLILLSVIAAVPARSQQIWFGPRTPAPGSTGAVDWSEMFQPDPQWNRLAGQIQVFFASPGYVQVTPDAQLKAVAANLASHHIAFGMPLGALAEDTSQPCSHREGYAASWLVPKIIEKLTSLGIQLQFLRIDGPLFFGHYDTSGCRLAVSQLVPREIGNIRALLHAFPNLVIGDVEGPQALGTFPDWEENFVAYVHQLDAAMGRKLAFVHVDTNWREADWPIAITTMARVVHANGMRFGVIYDSDGDAPNDQTWVTEAKRHFDELETRYGLVPDDAVFQTWNTHPDRIFPETSDSAHSWLVAQYLLPRTHLAVQRDATGLHGRLTQANGQPVAGARVEVETLGTDPAQPPPMHTVTGTVPPQARSAVLGLRVNTECWCSDDNDLVMGTLSYRETAGGSARGEYTYSPLPRTEAGLAIGPARIANQAFTHIKVARGHMLSFASHPFPVTPGARFELQVPLGSLNGKGLAGLATVIFLDAQNHGLGRTNITLGSDGAPVSAAVTDASGAFAAVLPAATDWQRRPLLVQYAGSPSLRAAYASP